MATPRRRISDHHRAGAAGGVLRAEPRFVCAGGGAGSVELRPASDPRSGDAQKPLVGDQFHEDKKLLANLIRGLVGENSADLSNELIDRFRSLPRVLKHFESEGAKDPRWPQDVTHLLANLSRTLGRVLQRELLPGPIVSTSDKLIAYLHHEMSQLKQEVFRVLFLDSTNRLLADHVMWRGSVSGVQIHPREVVREALACDATALILVHNHPSGDPTPSQHDIAITRRLIAACEPFDVAVHDHIVISRAGFASMRAEGLMQQEPPMTAQGLKYSAVSDPRGTRP